MLRSRELGLLEWKSSQRVPKGIELSLHSSSPRVSSHPLIHTKDLRIDESRKNRIYLKKQDEIYRKHFRSWLADSNPKPQPYQLKFRDLNMDTSLKVFCGDYIAEKDAKEVSDKYWQITQALELVNFPFGTFSFSNLLRVRVAKRL